MPVLLSHPTGGVLPGISALGQLVRILPLPMCVPVKEPWAFAALPRRVLLVTVSPLIPIMGVRPIIPTVFVLVAPFVKVGFVLIKLVRVADTFVLKVHFAMGMDSVWSTLVNRFTPKVFVKTRL